MPALAKTAETGSCGCHRQRGPVRMDESEAELSPTRLFSCTAPELARVTAAVGRNVTAAEARRAVGGAMSLARREATAVARALRAPVRSSATTRAFRSVFNVPPTFVPNWRPANATWRDLGDLVAIRIDNAARILVGGHMRVFCWGSAARCPECTRLPTKYVACSSYRGRYHICLGQKWWQWYRDGQRGFIASTLMHESLHIYFRLEHQKATVGRPSASNIFCYETLIALMMGRSLKPGLRDRCRTGQI